MKKCQHGYGPADDFAVCGSDEISDCCKATVSIGDGGFFCKCCYGRVERVAL